MALAKQRRSEIPEDAIILTEKEALKYQLNLMHNWKSSSDVFFFKYGVFILGGASALSGVYINSHYRYKFKLLHYGRSSSYIPIIFIPALLSVILHSQLVTNDLVLMKQNLCPVCIEMRSSAIQAMVGCVFPLILAPTSSLALLHRFGTYNMPYITKEPKEVFNKLIKMTAPIKNILFAIFIGQALLATIVTHYEAKSVFTVHEKLAKLEYDIEVAGKY